jgi:hypothetical protein
MYIGNLFKFILAITLAASMVACVSTKTVSENQVDDSTLTCESLATRLGEVRSAKAYAQANRGASGSNVMAALFFWPALLVNNSNTSDMIESMNQRESVLAGLYESNSCSEIVPEYDTKEMKKKLKSGDTLESFG